MKNVILSVLFILIGLNLQVSGQIPIPLGTSLDSITFNLSANSETQSFHLFKPTSYNSATSPIIIAFHGVGGNGTSEINDLDSIAERRGALIIGPNCAFSGFSTMLRSAEPVMVYTEITDSGVCGVIRPATVVLKSIYDYVLWREGRTNVPTYLIGFSAGGQFVSRYMLMRQVYPDSIPVKMAVSSNAYYYTFPTDTFLSVPMDWGCGLIPPNHPIPPYCMYTNLTYTFCSEHVLQYYNENYAVLIGTGDTQPLTGSACTMIEGNNRFERALNFYNFADSNALIKGTTLQWLYQEVQGVGHDQYSMYNNKLLPTDSSTIAESLLFDTPYHNVPLLAPIASFYADTTTVEVNNSINFINTSSNATSYIWDFGDNTTSNLVNPSHIYTSIGTFHISLTAINDSLCNNWMEKRLYINVIEPLSIIENLYDQTKNLITPNPSTGYITIHLNNNSENLELILFDIIGNEINRYSFSNGDSFEINKVAVGYYLFSIIDGKANLGNGKFIKL